MNFQHDYCKQHSVIEVKQCFELRFDEGKHIMEITMEKSSKKTMCISIFFIIFLIGTNANATFFSGSAIGSWGNVDSTHWNDVYSISNNDTGGVANFNWGVGGSYPATAFDNQFTFDGVGSDPGESEWNVEEDIAFLLGDFMYQNGSTYNSTGVDGVDLDVMISLTSPESMNYAFTSFFSITNTPNTTGDPVLDGDIVTLANTTGNTFTYAGAEYTLDILGFSEDSGNTFAYDFSSPEGDIQNAGIYGKISKTGGGAQVPEPATIFLLGSGLLGLFGYRKKFWKPKK